MNTKIDLLLIEDSPLDALLVQRLLDNTALFDVVTAGLLSDGLELLEKKNSDIILLDLTLPDSGGADTFRRIHESASGLPIIILSNEDDEGLAVQLMKNGAQDYLLKGHINQHILSRALLFALERKKTEEELRNAYMDLADANARLEKVIETSNQIAVKAQMTSSELNQIFNTTPDGMWVLDVDHTILRINDAFQALLGKDKNELVGKQCYDIFCSPICKTLECPMVRLQAGEKRVEIDIQRADGTEYILTSTPINRFEGLVSGIIANFKDITERKLIEQELRKANEKLENLSLSDGLTLISNRRRFDDTLASEWKRLYRENKSMALIFGDLDYFKLYNDTYGHQAGDECLQAVAQLIDQCTHRPADLAARYGGEEFAIILPNMSTKGALQLAERIRSEIRNLKIVHDSSLIDSYVTISLGVSCVVPQKGKSSKTIVAAADKALYEAKKNGRNCVVLKEM